MSITLFHERLDPIGHLSCVGLGPGPAHQFIGVETFALDNSIARNRALIAAAKTAEQLIEEAETTLRLRPEVAGLALPAAVSVFKYASPVVRITGTFFNHHIFKSAWGGDCFRIEGKKFLHLLGCLQVFLPGIMHTGGIIKILSCTQVHASVYLPGISTDNLTTNMCC